MISPFPLLAAFEVNPLQATIDYYSRCLTEDAIQWIDRRLHLNESQAAAGSIGFSDRSLGNQLPSGQTKAGREIRSRLVDLGIYKENGREALRGTITIPLYGEAGVITGIEGLRFRRGKSGAERIVIGAGIARPSGESIPLEKAIEPEDVSIPADPIPADSISSGVDSGSDASISVDATSVIFIRGDLQYRIRGMDKNQSSLSLKVSIAASRDGLLHLDTVDLMRSTARQAFIKAAATELLCQEETLKKDLGILLLQLEDLRNRQIDAAKSLQPQPATLTEEETRSAMALLQDPELPQRIGMDLERCGMVGEAFNKLAIYLAVVSRKLSQPLGILIQSSSSAGKTTLMDSILSMVPPEDYLRLSNLTSQSLYYLEGGSIRQKTLAISEDHGLAEASYALKLLQSEGTLTHATVVKGPNGKLVTQVHTVQGPVQLLLTSTSKDLDEELSNRCLVLTVDESYEQTRSIQHRQRMLHTRFGEDQNRKSTEILKLHRNAQRLLKPLKVYIPFADKLTFASDRTRLRRDNQKYLTLIQSIALLLQYQRPIFMDAEGRESIDVIPQDVVLANRLMVELLGRSLDELSPQTRRCLHALENFVRVNCKAVSVIREDYRFTRRAFREAIGWTDFQVRTHLDRLAELEYVVVHRGHRGRSYVYELAYDGSGTDGSRFVVGLCDPGTL